MKLNTWINSFLLLTFSFYLLSTLSIQGTDGKHGLRWSNIQCCFAAEAQTPGLASKIAEEVRSRIEASGRKMWEVKWTYSQYLNPPPGVEPVFVNAPSMAQELQFRLSGKVGERITINVEYDDTQLKKQKISVIYSGEAREGGIQEVNFGDQTLSIPGTEFVAYNKQLFGLSVRGQYQKFKYYFIGSQTKGYSETREFVGKSTSVVKDMWDINYYKMKYYILKHINPGRERIYIDDKNASNNTANTFYFSDTDPFLHDSITGYFDPLYSGVDYIINYGQTAGDSTVISFTRSIESNYTILVYDMDSNNTFAIKDELNTDTRTNIYELKNYYYLGNRNIVQNDPNFLLEVWDPDNTRHRIYIWPNTPPAGESYTVKINYDFGIVQFVDRAGKDFRPFRPDAYSLTNPVATYRIHAEYKARIQVFLLRPNLVEGSERVYLNGSLLKKDIDYTIDYESGFLSFLREDMITEDSVIKVDYEYMPFGGQYVETLIGARGELPLSPDFSIGSTYIYSGTPSPNDIPSIRSTPRSHQVIDVDSQMDPRSLLARLFPGIEKVPVSTSLSFEGAYSWKDPNTFGKAMIDDMEGARISIDVPMTDKYAWKISSAPAGESEALRGQIGGTVFNLGDKNESHDPNATNPKSIAMDYSLPETGSWVAICYPVSRSAQDYSPYSHIEFWVKSPPQDVRFFIDLGIISEDVDGKGGFPSDVYSGSVKLWSRGQPKTEDIIMADGRLNPGEDIGWTFVKPDSTTVQIGANNSRLDGEDLDGDGQLNPVDQKIHRLGGYFSELDSAGYRVSTSGSWILYRIPLSSLIMGDTDWTTVKHIRIWLKNESGQAKSGTLQMDSLSIVGNKWTNISISGNTGENTFNVEARNTRDNIQGSGPSQYTDPRDWNVPPGDEDGFNDDFVDLHPKLVEDLRGLDKSYWPKEQSLALVYQFTTPCTASVTQKFTTALNFTEYKKLKFWVFTTTGSSGGTLFIRFGMDDSNYFQYDFPLSTEGRWEIKTADLENIATAAMSSTFTVTDTLEVLWNIRQITLGIYDTNTSGVKKEIWVNEIYMDEGKIKEGYAFKAGLGINIASGLVNLGLNYKKMTHTFETIGVASPAEDYEAINANWSVPISRFMPAVWGISLPYSGSWSQTRTELDPNTVKDVPRYRLGLRNVITQSHSLSFSRSLLPNLSASYSHSRIESNFKGSEQKETQQNYSASAGYSYTFPRWLWYSLSINPSYSYSGSLREISIGPSFVDLNYIRDHTNDLAVSIGYQPVAQVNITPRYTLRTSDQQTGFNAPPGEIKPVARSQNFRTDASTTLIKGVSPTLSMNEAISENYFASGLDIKKNANASISLDLNANIAPQQWYSALKFFSFSNSFRMSANASYGTLDRKTDPVNINEDLWKVFVNIKGAKSSISDSRTMSSNQKTYILNSNFYFWEPLTTSASFSYGNDENQSASSFTSIHNLTYGGSARLDLNQVFPDFKKFASSSYLMGNFNHRFSETFSDTRSISRSMSMNPNANWQVRWNTDLNQNYSFNWTMDTTESGASLKTSSVISLSVRTDYNAQFPLRIPVPFWKQLVLANRFDLSHSFAADFKRSREDLKEGATNNYSTSIGATYNAAENVQITLSYSFSYFNNEKEPAADYLSHSVAFRGVIRF